MSISSDLLRNTEAAWTVLSCRPAGLITDVDGTISRVADRPEMATVHPRVLYLLSRLALRLDLVAAVSGRSIPQLLNMLNVEGMVYVGNHGLEWWEDGQATVVPEAKPHIPAIGASMSYLRHRLDLSGVLVEDKGATGCVHYRLSSDPTAARQAILQVIGQCDSARTLRVVDGRMVVNLVPPIRADKGTAVERLVRLRGLRGVVYLGDDLTDLDAFRALRRLRESGLCNALLVAVVSPEAPSGLIDEADHTLEGVGAVASFLRQTVAWQQRRDGARSSG